MLQSDPRENAVHIKNSDGHKERVEAMRLFQNVVEAQRDASKDIPLLHLAWCMLQEPIQRPTASSALEFDVFLVTNLERALDTPVPAGPISPNSGDVVAAAGKPASPTSGAIRASTPKGGSVSLVEGQAPHSAQPIEGANAENLDLPQRPLDVVLAVGDLMLELLPGDVPAFNKVMHRQMVNIIRVYACLGYR